MHYGVVVIWQSIGFSEKAAVTIIKGCCAAGGVTIHQVIGCIFILVECTVKVGLDVGPIDRHEHVPVNPVLLVPKPKVVKHFMKNHLFHLNINILPHSNPNSAHKSGKELTMHPGPRLRMPFVVLPTLAKHPAWSFLIRTEGFSVPTLATHLTQETASMSAMDAAMTARSAVVKSASIVYGTRPPLKSLREDNSL